MENGPATAAEWRLQLTGGPRTRHEAPLVLEAPQGAPDGNYQLLSDGGAATPAQIAHGRLLAVFPELAGGTHNFVLRPAPAAPQVQLTASAGEIAVVTGGAPFTTLHLEGAPKPYLYPVLAPGGVSVVRGWPVDPQPGDPTDHIHHRGIWSAHGIVNGVNAWEEKPGNVGRILLANAPAVAAGAVAGHVALDLKWVRPDDSTAALEKRLLRFWAVDGAVRLMDIESTYSGVDGQEVRWGDDKEGGLCTVRVAFGMEGKNGGQITTSEGAIGEAESWGSAAGWCDYSGIPALEANAGRQTVVGVTIFDHPSNPLHPMRWHVRDYGLMAANPFALSFYFPKQGRNGEWVIPAGTTATFRFRVLIHRGNAEEADVARRYADWAFLPRVKWS